MKCSRCDKTALYKVGQDGYCKAHRSFAVARRVSWTTYLDKAQTEKEETDRRFNQATEGSLKPSDYWRARSLFYKTRRGN